jgi:hypothetical protein
MDPICAPGPGEHLKPAPARDPALAYGQADFLGAGVAGESPSLIVGFAAVTALSADLARVVQAASQQPDIRGAGVNYRQQAP